MSYEDSSETIKVNDDNLNENELIIIETPPKPNELDIKPVLHRSKRKRQPPDRLDLWTILILILMVEEIVIDDCVIKYCCVLI